MKRIMLVAVAALALAGCGDKTSPSAAPTGAAPRVTVTADATEPAATAEVDPYGVYLANNPDPDLILSREDAQTRAYLGCGTEWAPGTVDRVLHDAYGATLCP